MTQQHLVTSTVGKERLGIVNELSLSIFDQQCNIVDSRMAVLGGAIAIIFMTLDESAVTSLSSTPHFTPARG